MSALRLCLVDMNNGHPNQAIRCFRDVIVEAFFARVRAVNPGLATSLCVVQPRNLRETLPAGCDLYLSSGGPGSPFEHDGEPLMDDLRRFFDGIVDGVIKQGARAPSFFGVCYTFELLIRHFAIADMVPRATRKFGVMPVYMTREAEGHPLTQPFGDRLFAFEHRNWEAVNLDERRLREHGGVLLARESRDGVSKGEGLLMVDFAPGIQGTQFHPEADRRGVVSWVAKREHAQAFVEAYGPLTYERMLSTLDNPNRLAKTFSLLIPGWLTRKFNGLAEARGWVPLEAPKVDMETFDGDAPSAASIRHDSLTRLGVAKALGFHPTSSPPSGSTPLAASPSSSRG